MPPQMSDTDPLAMSRNVVFVERHMAHFRVALYEGLRNSLDRDGVTMHLATGIPTPEEVAKQDTENVDWADNLPTRYLLGGKVCWMPVHAKLGPGDLLVLEHENKLVWNFWELYKPRHYKVAFWGHGRNMQSNRPNGPSERLKRHTTLRADWYFAYTEESRRTLLEIGFPEQRITVFNNAIDTRQLGIDHRSVGVQERVALARSLGLEGKPVGLFLGSLYAQKGLDQCLLAATAVRQRVPEFQWLVIGDGPDRLKVEAMAKEHSWVHWVGAKRGREKALYASLADVLMIPGAVGLVALDSLVLGKPIVTMRANAHGPEMEYLENGKDALITPDGVEAYSEELSHLLLDPQRLHAMQQACLAKAEQYTIEAMIARVHQGVVSALAG
jgi:glycosyltransferase involved in cell wall biosynthesis